MNLCCFSFTMNAGAGLFYEAAADLVYPMDEVVSGAMLSLTFSVFSAFYTLMGSTISPAAMNWLLTGALHGMIVLCSSTGTCFSYQYFFTGLSDSTSML